MNKSKSTEDLQQKFAHQLPSAFELFDQKAFTKRKPVIFLDFDGTLTPIVNDPNSARLDSSMHSILLKLKNKTLCAVITGRDRADIEQRIAIDSLIYAGSHGYDISGPNLNWIFEEGNACIPALENAQKELNKTLSSLPGIKIERKKFAIAVHYRHVSEEKIEEVLQKVNSIIEQNSNLRAGPGNMVMELKPNIEWHKGKALMWIMDHMNLPLENYIPIFFGDDLTDEDAFASIAKNGIGIVVGNQTHPTLAKYGLKDPAQVCDFLCNLNKTLF